MAWRDLLSGDIPGPAGWGRVHPARQTRRVIGVAGTSCFVSLLWVISAEAEEPVPYSLTAALQPGAPLVAANAPALQLNGGATPAVTPPVTPPVTAAAAATQATAAPAATAAPQATAAPTATAAPAATAAPTQTAAPTTTAPADDGHGGDHGGVITIPPTTNGSFDTSSGGS